MKFKRMAALAALFLALFPAPLLAGDFYISAKGGWAGLYLLEGDSIKVESKPGIHLSGAFGEIKGAWRVEVELAAQRNEVESVNRSQIDEQATGDIIILSAMGNVFYDFKVFESLPKWTPYVGVGAGLASVIVKDLKYSSRPQFILEKKKKSGNGLAWQLSLGFSYEMSDRISWDAGYRFLYINGASSEELGDLLTSSHSVTVGLRYLF